MQAPRIGVVGRGIDVEQDYGIVLAILGLGEEPILADIGIRMALIEFHFHGKK